MTCGFLIQLVFCKKNYVVYWCWSGARDECTPSQKRSWIRPCNIDCNINERDWKWNEQTCLFKFNRFANLPNYLANNIKNNDMEKIQKRTFSIIYPFTSHKDTLAKAGRDRKLKETTTKMLESILSEKLVLRQPNLHSSSAYCTCSNGSFTSLSYNTDCFANFVTVFLFLFFLFLTAWQFVTRHPPKSPAVWITLWGGFQDQSFAFQGYTTQ